MASHGSSSSYIYKLVSNLKIYPIVFISLLLLVSACEESNKKDKISSPEFAISESDSVISDVEQDDPEDLFSEVIFIGGEVSQVGTIYPPVILEPLPDFHLEGAHLSTTYAENYSGYWRNSSCSGLSFSRVGINGMSVEIYTGIPGSENIFGTINSQGELSIPDREARLNCEACDDIPPLTIDGEIDLVSMSGLLSFELVCYDELTYTISDTFVKLKAGSVQARPDREMLRIKDDIIELSGDDLHCDTTDQCKLINLKFNDLCNSDAIVYSSLADIEDDLYVLKNEYDRNKWLQYGNFNGSVLTLCSGRRQAMCEMNTCLLSDYL